MRLIMRDEPPCETRLSRGCVRKYAHVRQHACAVLDFERLPLFVVDAFDGAAVSTHHCRLPIYLVY